MPGMLGLDELLGLFLLGWRLLARSAGVLA